MSLNGSTESASDPRLGIWSEYRLDDALDDRFVAASSGADSDVELRRFCQDRDCGVAKGIVDDGECDLGRARRRLRTLKGVGRRDARAHERRAFTLEHCPRSGHCVDGERGARGLGRGRAGER